MFQPQAIIISFLSFIPIIILANICIKSVFLHSPEPLKPSSKLFCVVRQNEKIQAAKIASFETISRFEHYVPPQRFLTSSTKESLVESWESDRTAPFEYPAMLLSDQCTGTAPLQQSKNVSIICYPIWPTFNEKHCNDLNYLNASYYLRKYSIEKNGTRTILAVEGTPETNNLIRWLYWNGTACNNAVSRVVLTFFTSNGLLENIAASIQYANITNQSFSKQRYQFNAIFIETSTSMNIKMKRHPEGYSIGEVIKITSNGTIGAFKLPSGMDCGDGLQQIDVKFGFQINTSCRQRISTCKQMVAQIREIFTRLMAVTLLSLPNETNVTFAVQTHRSISEQDEKDESCELTTAASIQFAYVRFGNILAYSHKLISCTIALNKPDIVDLKSYSNQYIYLNFFAYFIDETASPIQIFSKTPTFDIVLPSDFFYPFFTKP